MECSIFRTVQKLIQFGSPFFAKLYGLQVQVNLIRLKSVRLMNILEVAILKNQFQVSKLGGHPRSIKTRSRLENDPKTDVSFRRGDVT